MIHENLTTEACAEYEIEGLSDSLKHQLRVQRNKCAHSFDVAHRTPDTDTNNYYYSLDHWNMIHNLLPKLRDILETSFSHYVQILPVAFEGEMFKWAKSREKAREEEDARIVEGIEAALFDPEIITRNQAMPQSWEDAPIEDQSSGLLAEPCGATIEDDEGYTSDDASSKATTLIREDLEYESDDTEYSNTSEPADFESSLGQLDHDDSKASDSGSDVNTSSTPLIRYTIAELLAIHAAIYPEYIRQLTENAYNGIVYPLNHDREDPADTMRYQPVQLSTGQIFYIPIPNTSVMNLVDKRLQYQHQHQQWIPEYDELNTAPSKFETGLSREKWMTVTRRSAGVVVRWGGMGLQMWIYFDQIIRYFDHVG
jgi:hypothetical protein